MSTNEDAKTEVNGVEKEGESEEMEGSSEQDPQDEELGYGFKWLDTKEYNCMRQGMVPEEYHDMEPGEYRFMPYKDKPNPWLVRLLVKTKITAANKKIADIKSLQCSEESLAMEVRGEQELIKIVKHVDTEEFKTVRYKEKKYRKRPHDKVAAVKVEQPKNENKIPTEADAHASTTPLISKRLLSNARFSTFLKGVREIQGTIIEDSKERERAIVAAQIEDDRVKREKKKASQHHQLISTTLESLRLQAEIACLEIRRQKQERLDEDEAAAKLAERIDAIDARERQDAVNISQFMASWTDGYKQAIALFPEMGSQEVNMNEANADASLDRSSLGPVPLAAEVLEEVKQKTPSTSRAPAMVHPGPSSSTPRSESTPTTPSSSSNQLPTSSSSTEDNTSNDMNCA